MNYEQAKQLRAAYEKGEAIKELARKHGVSLAFAYKIIRNSAYFDPDHKPKQNTSLRSQVGQVLKLRSKGYSQERIGIELAKKVGREKPYSSTLVGQILKTLKETNDNQDKKQ